ncbi:LysM peptidoglycan-binding domain-containing protein [Kitasatospora sp. NPDC086801]|uniref:LysM peptidoglycan-binding domain-containing protein n=1 Tax=Kitasatospora sp. NPDC086801 TaxID=3364066 RepID=UPI003824383C
MPTDPLAGLFDALESAKQAGRSISLCAAFMTSSGATPPNDLDPLLRKAFRLREGDGLQVGLGSAEIGPVAGDTLTVTGAQVSFLGRDAAKSSVTLLFTRGAKAVEVLVAVELTGGWTFSDTFTAMVDPPFTLFPCTDATHPTFAFTTLAGPYVWQPGVEVRLSRGQNFVGQFADPSELGPYLALLELRSERTVVLAGPIEVDRVTEIDGVPETDEAVVLYPDMDLSAVRAEQPVELFDGLVSAKSPGLRLLVATEPATSEDDLQVDQGVQLFVTLQMDVNGTPYELRTPVSTWGKTFTLDLLTPEGKPLLSLSDAVAILGRTTQQNPLSRVPSPLQGALSSVGLQGLTLRGALEPPPGRLAWAEVVLGTSGKVPLFTDPSNGQAFALDAFAVDWTVLDPLDAKNRSSLVALSARFRLWPKVFKGIFVVSIDQSLSLQGRFDGSVTLSDVITGVTNGAVQPPDGVNVKVSDIRLGVGTPSKSYALSGVVDADVSFITLGGKPLITVENMNVLLAAVTPNTSGAKSGSTAYRAELSGYLAVGPLAADVGIRYQSAGKASLWELHAALAQSVPLGELVDQFFRAYSLPAELLPEDLAISELAVDAAIPSSGKGKTAEYVNGAWVVPSDAELSPGTPTATRSSYRVAGELLWTIAWLDNAKAKAAVGLQYDGATGFSGQVVGDLYLPSLGTHLTAGYRFGTAAQDAVFAGAVPLPPGTGSGADSKVLWIQWEGVTGQYDSTTGKLTLSLAGWTVGGLVQALVHTLGDPYFTLDAPWDMLNKISLDGLKLTLDLGAKKPTIAASYTLSAPIDLGFLKITGLTFLRNDQGKVTLQIVGSSTIGDIQSSPLMKPGGQDVTSLPAAPGQGTQWFDLRLLMLGQRVGINGGSFADTEAVIKSLEGIPGTQGDTNPVKPDDQTPGQVRYDADSNWLIAAHFVLLKGTIDAMLVFNDPNLYGFRLALNGEKAKVLDGLVLDVMYKKVTDDVGVYSLDFTFPNSLRNLDFGAVSVTLPAIGVRIYTNGDFLVDFGFPYRMDFSRSFTLQAIVAGIPVIGSAGFYFGRLSVGAKSELPANARGTFGTATTFGIGLQLGVGKTIEKGPLKAGFSVTAFGIVEGIIASWEPEKAPAVRSANSAALQSDYFFRLRGTFGLSGQLYGAVDFGVIKGSVDVSVKLSATILYEAYADIQLSASASVRVAVSLHVNLGLFSFDLHFSFAATVTAELTIHTSDRNPPWGRSLTRPRATELPALTAAPVWKTVKRTGAKPALTLCPVPQYTVHAPASASAAKDQQGSFVLLLATDAPTATGDGNASGSSFQSLCDALLPWVIDAYTTGTGTEVDLDTVLKQSVTGAQLRSLVVEFGSKTAPFTASDIERKLLGAGFTVKITAAAENGGLSRGATTFPAFAGLTVTFPVSTGTATVALDQYTTIDSAYRDRMDAWFAELAARVEQEQKSTEAGEEPEAGADTQPLAQYLFEDWFRLVIRQLLQAGADSFGDYRYPLTQQGNGLKAVLDWAHGRGNEHLTALDVAVPNAAVPLTTGKRLRITALAYTVQNGDSLTGIAGRYSDTGSSPRWTCDAGELLRTNADRHGLVAAGAVISSSGRGPYTTQPGDSFTSVADALGLTVRQLGDDKALSARTDLLAPSVPVDIPTITYTTGADDSLQSVAQRFATPLATLVDDAENQAVTGLFAASALQLPDLDRLLLSDVLTAITADGQVAHTAGMAARYSLHGMRLPKLDGLALPKDFRYPADQSDYGLYQLTGQQFPVPETIPATYDITLGKGAGLGWLTFSEGAATVDLSEPARRLRHVRDWARKNLYDPAPALELQPASVADGKRYAAQSATPWSTSDQAALTALTSSAAGARAAGAAPQAQPLLWDLPPSLLRHVEQRQAALATRFTPVQALPHLPLFTPETATADPTTAHAVLAPVSDYVYATRVQFQVKKLAQTDGGAPQTPQANDVLPPDDGNKGGPAPLAPFTYQVIGPSPADAAVLERLLTSLGTDGTRDTDLISGLFLLLPDSGRGRAGLTSRGTRELLAFLTRTNLTTETAPPTRLADDATGDEPARGILTPPAELVRLLWELSTVRTGGYYLYYQVPKEGAGLPDSVFDSSGTATLTLVVTYRRDGDGQPGDGRLTGYVNTLLTTGAIDPEHATLTFASQPSPARGAKLDGHETLADLAGLYGTDPGVLARLNASVALPTGLKIPVPDGLHQVSADDLRSTDVLAAVAAHWSENASEKITKEQLAAHNPGVTPSLGTALRIPPITRLTASGDTLRKLVDHYGISPEELGWAARDVVGVFPATTQPSTDSEELTVSPVLGSGNTGVSLTRNTPATPGDLPNDPTEQQVEDFSTATLGQLFSLLSPGVEGNAFFTASPQGLPAGPVDSSDAPGTRHVRRPEAARALLLDLANAGTQSYRQTVGFRAYAKVNPAPAVEASSGLPSRADNPYAGVGTPAQLRLRWHDVFGNLAVTPFDAPPAGYSGPLDRRPDPLHYEDRVIGLAQWPNVRTGYSYQGQAGSPSLTVGLQLMTEAYEEPTAATDPRARILPTGLPDWQQRAVNDLRTFTTVYYQLNQDYDRVSVPGLSGNAMTLTWTNSLLREPEQSLTTAHATALRSFVADCVKYLGKRAAGQAGGTAPGVDLTSPVPVTDLVPDDIVPLSLALTLARRDELVDPALRSTAVHADTTAIMPAAGADDRTEVSLQSFATAMEAAFRTDDWQFRVGTSAAATGPGPGDDATLWAVRMALKPGKGLGYTIGRTPGFYAPKPLATALRDGTATVGRYSTGQEFKPRSQSLAFTGIDLNTWARQALTAIDAFLTPTFTSPARIVDQLTATDPEDNGALPQILQQKKRLAAAIAATVSPVLKDSPDDGTTLAAASDKMEQALLDHLGAAYTVSAVTVLPVTDARVREPLPAGVTAPRFYGQVRRDPAKRSAEVQDFALSTAKIPLTPQNGTGTSRLAFLFESRNATARTHVRLDVQYPVTHLEHDIRSVPGIEDYRSSRWITWVTGPVTTPLGTIDFPVVLRELPQPPSVTDQSALPTRRTADGFPQESGTLTPKDLTEWDYAFDYRYDSAAQDLVHAHVVFNTGSQARALRGDAEAALFTALAQFTAVHPAVAADLETHLRPVDAAAKASDTGVVDGKFALAALVRITTDLADAYAAWAGAGPAAGAGKAGPQLIEYDFRLGLSDDAGSARVDVYCDKAKVPEPQVRIAPETYAAQRVTPPSDAQYAWEFTDKDAVKLRYADAPAERTVGFSGLGVFGHQDGHASVKVVRNEHLVPAKATADGFVFTTPTVAFAVPVVPLLAHASYDLGSLKVTDKTVKGYLTEFVRQLLADTGNLAVAVKLSAAYAFSLQKAIKELPLTVLPISLLPLTVTGSSGAAAWIGQVAESVEDFRAAYRPVSDESARVTFRLEVFAAGEAQHTMPLLTIRELFVMVSQLKQG